MTEHAFGAYGQPTTAAQEIPAQVGPAAVAAYNSGASLLDALAAEAKKEIGRKVRYDISNRPGWTAEFETNIDPDDFNRYRKAAQGKKKRAEDMDPTLFGGMALVEYNTGIFHKGELVELQDGSPLLFRSQEFLGMFGDGVYTAVDALVKFAGGGHVIAMGNALYGEAGYGDEVAPVDPTDA